MTHLITLDYTSPWRTTWPHRWLQREGRILRLLALHLNGVMFQVYEAVAATPSVPVSVPDGTDTR